MTRSKAPWYGWDAWDRYTRVRDQIVSDHLQFRFHLSHLSHLSHHARSGRICAHGGAMAAVMGQVSGIYLSHLSHQTDRSTVYRRKIRSRLPRRCRIEARARDQRPAVGQGGQQRRRWDR